SLLTLLFLFYWYVEHPHLHSFPTRRSSDLRGSRSSHSIYRNLQIVGRRSEHLYDDSSCLFGYSSPYVDTFHQWAYNGIYFVDFQEGQNRYRDRDELKQSRCFYRKV